MSDRTIWNPYSAYSATYGSAISKLETLWQLNKWQRIKALCKKRNAPLYTFLKDLQIGVDDLMLELGYRRVFGYAGGTYKNMHFWRMRPPLRAWPRSCDLALQKTSEGVRCTLISAKEQPTERVTQAELHKRLLDGSDTLYTWVCSPQFPMATIATVTNAIIAHLMHEDFDIHKSRAHSIQEVLEAYDTEKVNYLIDAGILNPTEVIAFTYGRANKFLRALFPLDDKDNK